MTLDVSAAARTYAGNPETPRVNTLIESLTKLIDDMETRGVTDAFTDHDNWDRYAKTLGFYCDCAVLPDTSLKPGILFAGTLSEQPRTTYLDHDVTAYLQEWLDSEQSTNARQSLAGCPGIHVLTLMASLDGPAAGMIHTLQETHGEVPSVGLRLPAEIDILIVATNTDMLRFTPHDGWSRRGAPSP